MNVNIIQIAMQEERLAQGIMSVNIILAEYALHVLITTSVVQALLHAREKVILVTIIHAEFVLHVRIILIVL